MNDFLKDVCPLVKEKFHKMFLKESLKKLLNVIFHQLFPESQNAMSFWSPIDTFGGFLLELIFELASEILLNLLEKLIKKAEHHYLFPIPPRVTGYTDHVPEVSHNGRRAVRRK